MKVYISGPISSITDGNYYNFEKAEIKLTSQGHEVINPHKINKPEDHGNRAKCLRNDIRHMTECDGIYMLYGWENSKGACLEHTIACNLEFKMMYEQLEKHV